MESPPTPTYTDEERERMLVYFLALKKEQIQAFLVKHKLSPRSGTKAEIGSHIEDWINSNAISYEHLVQYLDALVPWGKQHVYLYKGPTTSIADWKKSTWIETHLKKHNVDSLLNVHLPLILPSSLSLSSIIYTAQTLRVVAIERRDEWLRDSDKDEQRQTELGEEIELRAYLHLVTRGLIAFEWDLLSNTAFLQIMQLPGSDSYEDAQLRFKKLVEKWLNLDQFSLVDICPAIKKLHELEEANTPEARSHGVDYRSLQGRSVSARSASTNDSIVGETNFDEGLKRMRQDCTGRIGNFYWLPKTPDCKNGVPSPKEVHVTLVGDKSRINFATPNTKEDIHHVLNRVRSLST